MPLLRNKTNSKIIRRNASQPIFAGKGVAQAFITALHQNSEPDSCAV